MSNEAKKLYRSRKARMIAGVCGGLGEYLDTDPTVIRLVTVLLAFVFRLTVFVYLVLILVVPEEPLGPDKGVAPEPPAAEEPSTE